jgi:hypothetical protein
MVPTIPKLQVTLPSDNAYLVSKWLKQGIKLKGYYPYFGVQPFTFPSKSNSSKRRYIKTFMEVAEYGIIEYRDKTGGPVPFTAILCFSKKFQVVEIRAILLI